MGSPIRVLHVIVNMNRGGAETLVMNLYRNIDRSQVQFDFLTSKAGVFDEEIRQMGGVVHRIPYITDQGYRAYKKSLLAFFREHRDYHIVHSHMDRMSGLVLHCAQQAGTPVRIAHSHNTRSEGGYAGRLFKWYIGRSLRNAATDRFACSDDAARWLFAGKAAQSVLLQNGIERERFAYDDQARAQVREELGLPDSSFVVGHIGRFLLQKNHAYLLDRFAELCAIRPEVFLLLAGDGPLRSAMEQRVHQLGIASKVKFLGVRGDVHRLLQAFDVLLFPSLHEGLPVTLVEAQGSGLRCLVSDAVSDEADMGLGLVRYFPLGDKKQCLDQLIEAMDRPQPRRIAPDALAAKGYDIKDKASWVQQYYYSRTR
ncbi:glycosyltransferase family 1 protein [Cohnella soli]|uniref:Glycosyltransferase family 1 protein n=1 Tax=Cohnella soli TaxID=425005 RepID=A0ABW0I0K3_9BACL